MRPTAVIRGTYHQNMSGLKRIFKELELTGCRILSPISINFRDTSIAVVRADHESEFNIDELERFHLRAIKSADFVILHAPNGHIGVSGSFEIGYANAIGKSVFALNNLQDEMLASRVLVVGSVFEIVDQLHLTFF
jgi:hypothetical protein